jgi:hypothetical protein
VDTVLGELGIPRDVARRVRAFDRLEAAPVAPLPAHHREDARLLVVSARNIARAPATFTASCACRGVASSGFLPCP